jgi:hypothetical protein
VRVHGDAKFKKLSSPAPCGKYLWFYLLTNKRTTNIPGLYEAGEAALAEELGWPLKAFREAFREASTLGMVFADWDSRLIWIPNAIKHNVPESPNVVKSWAVLWDELPECSLKTQARSQLKAFMEGLSEAFVKAFEKACPKAMPNQEQEQEQEQEQDLTPLARSCSRSEPSTQNERENLAQDENAIVKIPLSGNLEHLVTESDIAAWSKSFPAVDVVQELRKIREWNLSRPANRKTKRGVRAHITGWLSRAQDRSRARSPSAESQQFDHRRIPMNLMSKGEIAMRAELARVEEHNAKVRAEESREPNPISTSTGVVCDAPERLVHTLPDVPNETGDDSCLVGSR